MSEQKLPPATVFGSSNAVALSDALALVEHVPTASIGLVYIDPPLFPTESGSSSETEIMRTHLVALGKVFQQVRRCLDERGNLFVHSEPQMNGRIRLLLDQIFGQDNFRQEIIVPHVGLGHTHRLKAGHDTVFHFSVGSDFVFNPQTRPLGPPELTEQFRNSDLRGPYRLASLTVAVARPSQAFEWRGFAPPRGGSWRFSSERLDSLFEEGRIEIAAKGSLPRLKQYMSDHVGIDVGSVWNDLPHKLAKSESASFPTQKSEGVLGRIIRMGSNEGGMVLDPYCGSGTSLVVAHKSGRRWVGGDNSADAISTTTRRLNLECGLESDHDYIRLDEGQLCETTAFHLPSIRFATGFDDLLRNLPMRLVFGEPLQIEETRHYEFKEVNGHRPFDSIANTADEYAVAFLNSEGGHIFWGVRDSDHVVVGIKLHVQDRDRLRQKVTNKLGTIRPAIDPTSYRLEIHPIIHPDSADMFVVELVVPNIRVRKPFFTGGNEAFVRLDGVKRKLAGPELYEWIVSRHSNG